MTSSSRTFRSANLPNGEQSLPSKQILRAPGQQLQFGAGRWTSFCRPTARHVYIKNMNNLLVVDAGTWTLLQTLSYPGTGASMHGIAVKPDGSHVYVTGAGNELYEWAVGTNGLVAFSRTISLPAAPIPAESRSRGDGTKAYVCLSIANKLCEVNLTSGTVTADQRRHRALGRGALARRKRRPTFRIGAAASRSGRTQPRPPPAHRW